MRDDNPMTPTVGRIVHYFDSMGQREPWPAIITRVDSDDYVAMTVFAPEIDPFHASAGYSSDRIPGKRWVWPQVKPERKDEPSF